MRKLYSLAFAVLGAWSVQAQQINLPGVPVIAPPTANMGQFPSAMPQSPGGMVQGLGPATASAPEPVAPVASRNVPNANQQGVGQQTDRAEMNRRQADFEAMNTPRQRGEVVRVPLLVTPLSSQKEHAQWFGDWVLHLNALGMSSVKIQFEANRLSKEDFSRWASRQVIARQNYQSFEKVQHVEGQAEIFSIND